VTHLDIDDEGIERAAAALAGVLEESASRTAPR
jgi:hypothetical protein